MATPLTPKVTISTAGATPGTIICPNNPGRRGVTVSNTSGETIWLFGTTLLGFPLLAGQSIPLDITGPVIAMSASTTATTACIETDD